MLPEVASGMVETRNIVTPVRSFCKKAKFYQAKIESIDLNSEKLTLTHAIGRRSQPNDWREHILKYDYLVTALGSENNFFKTVTTLSMVLCILSFVCAIFVFNSLFHL